LGDATYAAASKLIARQALHARTLSFEYKGINYSYIAPYPKDLENAIKTTQKSKIGCQNK
jgi:hypothetical protein